MPFKHITRSRADNYDDRFRVYSQDEIHYDENQQYYYITEQGGQGFEFEDPNFKFLQFRSNLVIRWEYRPGSTLYLVWSQGRTDVFSDDIDFPQLVTVILLQNFVSVFLKVLYG